MLFEIDSPPMLLTGLVKKRGTRSRENVESLFEDEPSAVQGYIDDVKASGVTSLQAG